MAVEMHTRMAGMSEQHGKHVQVGAVRAGALVCGRTPGCQVPEYAGGAPRGDGADHRMGQAWTRPVHGSCVGRQLGDAGGALGGGGGRAGGGGCGRCCCGCGGQYMGFLPR
jgi:hypothetical protein